MRSLSMVCEVAYRVEVQGTLDERWSGQLGGLAITVSAVPEGHVETRLEGILADQASLLRVLRLLNELHLPLLSVALLDVPASRDEVVQSGAAERDFESDSHGVGNSDWGSA